MNPGYKRRMKKWWRLQAPDPECIRGYPPVEPAGHHPDFMYLWDRPSLKIILGDKCNNKCIGCGILFREDLVDARIDHIVPYSYGGSHHIKNLQLLCVSCNSRKSNTKTTDEIASRRQRSGRRGSPDRRSRVGSGWVVYPGSLHCEREEG